MSEMIARVLAIFHPRFLYTYDSLNNKDYR